MQAPAQVQRGSGEGSGEGLGGFAEPGQVQKVPGKVRGGFGADQRSLPCVARCGSQHLGKRTLLRLTEFSTFCWAVAIMPTAVFVNLTEERELRPLLFYQMSFQSLNVELVFVMRMTVAWWWTTKWTPPARRHDAFCPA